MRVVYVGDDGVLCVVIPTPEALAEYGIDAIAKKDVPEGRPYKIVQEADIPQDRSQRDKWTVDVKALTDGVGSESNEIDEDAPKRATVGRAVGLVRVAP